MCYNVNGDVMARVLVGMSGGVDSSVAAVLLKEQGYEVVGITFQFTEEFDASDAKKVCEKLNIEHHIVDYKTIFKNKVIDKFIEDYNQGITPNPCFLCNREVKFNFLYQNMDNYHCEYIATGHYAKIKNNHLFVSADLKKDQTYFLGLLPSSMLSKLLLPLEGLTKDEVRNIAHKYELINANRKDSTDVCFITSKFKDYMQNKLDDTPGNIVDVATMKVIGQHKGLAKYTIGQRKGLNIGGAEKRMYVVGKDMNRKILYIAFGDNNEFLISTSCQVINFNLIGDKVSTAQARFRYHQPLIDVEIEYLDNNEIIVRYNRVKAVTPGQACVLYLNGECLGGGIIKEVRKDENRIWYL